MATCDEHLHSEDMAGDEGHVARGTTQSCTWFGAAISVSGKGGLDHSSIQRLRCTEVQLQPRVTRSPEGAGEGVELGRWADSASVLLATGNQRVLGLALHPTPSVSPTCFALSFTVWLNTVQMTPWEQGGVVRDPS